MKIGRATFGKVSAIIAPAGVALGAALIYLGRRAEDLQRNSAESGAADPYYWTAFVGLPTVHGVALLLGIAALVRAEPRLWAGLGIGLNALVLAVFAGFLWLIAWIASMG